MADDLVHLTSWYLVLRFDLLTTMPVQILRQTEDWIYDKGGTDWVNELPLITWYLHIAFKTNCYLQICRDSDWDFKTLYKRLGPRRRESCAFLTVIWLLNNNISPSTYQLSRSRIGNRREMAEMKVSCKKCRELNQFWKNWMIRRKFVDPQKSADGPLGYMICPRHWVWNCWLAW